MPLFRQFPNLLHGGRDLIEEIAADDAAEGEKRGCRDGDCRRDFENRFSFHTYLRQAGFSSAAGSAAGAVMTFTGHFAAHLPHRVHFS